MRRADAVQFNVRSRFAKTRAQELARLTGMTATQVVEEALRAFVPPASTAVVGQLVQRGPLLVLPAEGHAIRREEANAALTEVRDRAL